eukprot:gnl/TRDRNA2_/TRDRNA2_183506_c0_seq1.p1 gnl/TRDRNA2_/TRDRNA2_183506_c0~~gnl/TRDRNA2_/TRDRNA2_183506_c0_seq1.p1  ORF type:complete len:442 (-),score=50.28 gnl/TRDRNA2_/TRDRNA2_183506_c0_seq1:29-1285(-)
MDSPLRGRAAAAAAERAATRHPEQQVHPGGPDLESAASKQSADRARRTQDWRSRFEDAQDQFTRHARPLWPGIVEDDLKKFHARFGQINDSWNGFLRQSVSGGGPASPSRPALTATSQALARNPESLEREVDAVLSDLWDGISATPPSGARHQNVIHNSGQLLHDLRRSGDHGPYIALEGSRQMDRQAETIERRSSATQRPSQLAVEARLPSQHDVDSLARRAGYPAEMQPPPSEDGIQKQIAAPTANRKELEQLLAHIDRLEKVMEEQARREEENAPMPPPPPLVKLPPRLTAQQYAKDFNDIAQRISVAEVGRECDTGGTPQTAHETVGEGKGGVVWPTAASDGGVLDVGREIQRLQVEVNAVRRTVRDEARAKRSPEPEEPTIRESPNWEECESPAQVFAFGPMALGGSLKPARV